MSTRRRGPDLRQVEAGLSVRELMKNAVGKRIYIIGAGGHGSEIFSYLHNLTAQGEMISAAGFVDEHKARGPFGESEIIGDFDELRRVLSRREDSELFYITAVGSNAIRRELVNKLHSLDAPNLKAWTLLHPQSVVGFKVEIGEGTCLAPGSILTTNINIGRHCIINVNASVSHDCVVGDFVNINPGAVVAGNVKIGEGCFIGAGATLIDKVSIGEWATIGAGAVVINDIPPGATAVGVPARVIKRQDK